MNFYNLALSRSIHQAFLDKDWIFETKWDGFRAIDYVKGRFFLQSRNAKELKYAFPVVLELSN